MKLTDDKYKELEKRVVYITKTEQLFLEEQILFINNIFDSRVRLK